MKAAQPTGPQQTLLYRAIALGTRFQLGYLLRGDGNRQLMVAAFVLCAGVTALAIIALLAWVTRLTLLFPPLGPSAFVLFYRPMAEQASPRNVILSHTMALAAGVLSLRLALWLFPGPGILDPAMMSWPRLLAITLAMGVISALMVALRCAHPPAAATALLGAMGFFENPLQMLGLLIAVLLLVAEAFVLNRLVGGLPYPRWRSDPKISRHFVVLAGIPESGATYWQQLAARLQQRRES
jgi:CBS-domain-containing membrane protein